MARIKGTIADDTLNGTAGKDTIKGLGGNDTLFGGNGRDKLYGGAGNDTLNGENGNDRLYGGNGIDYLYGGAGNDYIDPGNNKFFDWIDPGAGTDIVDFSGVTYPFSFYNLTHWDLTAGITATLDGTTNTGTIDKGINGTTTLTNMVNALNAGGLRLIGSGLDDVFNINPGNTGSIQIRSSGGNDTINIATSTGEVLLGFRSATTGVTVNLATGVVSNDGLGGTDTITGPGQVTWVYGSYSNDTITGSGNDEAFSLYGGTDTLNAGGGYDLLDYFRGAGGELDTAIVDLGAGTASGIINAAAFTHTISGIESVRGSGGADALTGSAGTNRLDGRDGDDMIRGGGGKDTLLGGKGNDKLWGDKGNDRLQGEAGADTLTGGNGNDILRGGGGKDTLLGGAGNDKMTGGGGADRFIFSSGADVVTDFNAANNREKVDLSGVAAITSFASLKAGFLTDTGGNVVIDDGAGNTLTLNGLGSADLDQGDFIF